MKSLNQFINEKLIITKDLTYNNMELKFPTNRNELIDIIIDEVKKYNGGTIRKPIDLNFIRFDKWNFDGSYKSNIKTLFKDVVEILKYDNVKLYAIDISRWNVSEFDSFEEMFKNCKNLKLIKGLEHWDVSGITTMECMFANCSRLEDIGNISDWNITSCVNFKWMFSQCEKLKKLDLEPWGKKLNKTVLSNILTYYCMTSGTKQPIWSWMMRK